MSDLISRQALKNSLTNWQMEYAEKSKDVERFETLGAVIELVEQLPTIDPVKHGKWRWFPDKMVNNTDVSFVGECSVCKHLSKECGRFCNWCGARMDGE